MEKKVLHLACKMLLVLLKVFMFFVVVKIAEEIRHILDNYDKAIPAILEIPSKEHPYDPSKDSILRRAKVMFIFNFLNVLQLTH